MGAVFGAAWTNGEPPKAASQFLARIFAFLTRFALIEVGLFRVSGDSDRVDKMRKEVNQDPTANFPPDSIHEAASLLKQFFRDMPQPLIPYSHYAMFVGTAKETAGDNRKEPLKEVLSGIPKGHFEVLRTLCLFLHKVSSNSSVNKMTPQNIATCFAPNIARPEVESMSAIILDAGLVCSVFMELVESATYFFESSTNAPASASPSFPSSLPSARPSAPLITVGAARSNPSLAKDAVSPSNSGARLGLPNANAHSLAAKRATADPLPSSSSSSSTQTAPASPSKSEGPAVLFQVQAVYPYTARNDTELSLEVGRWYKVLQTEPSNQWYQAAVQGRMGWFPAQCVKKVDLSVPEIPKNLKVKAHLLRNVNLQQSLEEKYSKHREEAQAAMATMQKSEANPKRFDNRMRRASFLIREGNFDFKIDHNVLENALSVLHSLKEAEDDDEDEDLSDSSDTSQKDD